MDVTVILCPDTLFPYLSHATRHKYHSGWPTDEIYDIARRTSATCAWPASEIVLNNIISHCRYHLFRHSQFHHVSVRSNYFNNSIVIILIAFFKYLNHAVALQSFSGNKALYRCNLFIRRRSIVVLISAHNGMYNIFHRDAYSSMRASHARES